MDKVIKNERGLELVTSCSSGYDKCSEKLKKTFSKKFDDVM